MPRIRPILLARIFAMAFITFCFRAGEKDGLARRSAGKIQQARAAAEAAIRVDSAAWSQAATAQGPDKVICFCADDALQFPKRARATKGKENIRKNWAQLLVANSGELAQETGRQDFVSTDQKRKSSDEKGKYVVVWKKQSGGSQTVVVDTDETDQSQEGGKSSVSRARGFLMR